MNSTHLPRIGILGGMGPAASAELYKKIIQVCQTEYRCVQDEDFPPVFVNSITLSGFDEKGIVDAKSVERQLIHGVRELAPLVDLIAIPCNTVHAFYDSMQKESSVPILSLPELACRRIFENRYKKVGLLCSQSTRDMKLYHSVLEPEGVSVLLPSAERQESINDIIRHVMGGNQTIHDDKMLQRIAQELKIRGAEAMVIGCTELPFAMSHLTELPVFDTLQILAEGAVKAVLG